MRFLVMVKANEESEAGALPPPELFEEMSRFNEELIKAGVLLEAAGLLPSSEGVRIDYAGRERTVTDGPFTEAKELVAGFWIWQVRSKEEAIAWAKRIPFDSGEVELRRLAEMEDFGEEISTHVKEHEERRQQANA